MTPETPAETNERRAKIIRDHEATLHGMNTCRRIAEDIARSDAKKGMVLVPRRMTKGMSDKLLKELPIDPDICREMYHVMLAAWEGGKG